MIHRVKRFGEVDGYGCCSGGGFGLIEPCGYCVGDWKKGSSGGMEWPETMLGAIHC